MSKYISEFLSLNCVPDILGVVNPINKIEKEISEAMAIRNVIRQITLKEPQKYAVLDLCAGNALGSVLTAFTLPVIETIAVDKLKRDRDWHKIRAFTYLEEEDIYEEFWTAKKEKLITPYPIILISIHCCKDLANQIIKIYHANDNIKHLIIMPCCEGPLTSDFIPEPIRKAGKYECWGYQLSQRAGGVYFRDRHCLSPKNIIIKANKE